MREFLASFEITGKDIIGGLVMTGIALGLIYTVGTALTAIYNAMPTISL